MLQQILISIKKRKILIVSAVVLFIVFPILYLTFKYQKKIEAVWWNDNWEYRKVIAISSGSAATTDYQILINDYDTATDITAGKMQTDCDDIRFTSANGVQLPYWIESGCNTSTTDIWVKVDSIPATSGTYIYMYYGNATATIASNEDNTFIFADDFEQDDQIKWANGMANSPSSVRQRSTTQKYSGSYSYEAYQGDDSDPDYNTIIGKNLTSGDKIFEGMFYDNTSVTDSHDVFGSSEGGTWVGNYATISTTYYVARCWWTAYPYVTTTVARSTGWHRFKIVTNSSGSTVYIDGTSAASCAGDVYGSSVFYGNFVTGTGGDYADNIFVREYLATEPTVSAPGTEEKTQGPIAYWKLDEGADNTCSGGANDACDATQNRQDGAESNLSWQNEDLCVNGKCGYFNGSSSTVTVTDNSRLKPSQITITGWLKINEQKGANVIYKGDGGATGQGYNIYTYNTGSLQFWIYNGAGNLVNIGTGANTLIVGKWHHFSATYDGTNTRIYLDGVLRNVSSSTSGLTQKSVNLTLGNATFHGSLDDIKIYDYARSAAQVKADYVSRGSTKGVSTVLGMDTANTLSQNLIGYWKADEATWSGTLSEVVDASGNGNHGQAAGATGGMAYPSNGKFGNSGYFDGVDDYVNIPTSTSLSIAGSLSLSAWVETLNTGNAFIISKGTYPDYNYKLEISDNELQAAIGVSGSQYSVDDTENVTAGRWYHVVTTYDGVNLRLYVNGQLKGTTSIAGTPSTNSTDLRIGNYASGGYQFRGYVDDARLYNRALSPKEVRDLYSFAPGPTRYWNFNENTGSTAYDVAGGASGSITGASWSSGKYGSALNFNGTSGKVTGDTPTITNSFTASAWVNVFDTNTRTIFCTRTTEYGFDFKLQSGTTIHGDIGNGSTWIDSSADATFSYSTNTWYYITYVVTPTYYTIYVNGVQKSSEVYISSSPVFSNSTHQILIGSCSASEYFNGKIDDAKIYNYARTSGQIIEDMNAGHPMVGSPVSSAVAYYKFDEGYGDTINNYGSGGSGLNLTRSGATWNNNGKYGKALLFNGNGDYTSRSDDDSLDARTDSLTVSLWINAAPTASTHDFIVRKGTGGSTDAGYALLVSDSSGKARVYVNDGSSNIVNSLTGNITIADRTWHYVTFTWDPTVGAKIYVDGKLDVQTNVTTTVDINSSTSFYVVSSGSTYTVDGLIDEVKIYRTALTEDQIKLDMNHGSAIVLGSSSIDNLGQASNSATTSYCSPGNSETNCASGSNPAPVGEWKMDEGVWTNNCSTDTVFDTSGNGYHGDSCPSSTGPTGGAVGKYGKGGYFDGSNDYLSITDNDNIDFAYNQNFTVSLWAKIPSTQNNTSSTSNSIYEKWSGTGGYPYIMRLNNQTHATPGRIIVARYDGTNNPGITSTASYNDNTWHYFTFSKNSSTLSLYVDGKLNNTATDTTTGTTTNSSALIIGNRGGSSLYYYGYLDDMKIYNYARTPAQVAWDYNRGAPVGHWKMDECQGGTIYDSSGNSQNGTWYGTGSGVTSVGTCTTSSTAWYNGATGKFNASLDFDGSDDYVLMSTDVIKVTGGTISFWIKTSGNPDSWDDGLVGSRSISDASSDWDIQITLHVNDNIEMQVYGAGGGLSSGAINDSQWHHVVATWYEGGATDTEKLYIDGVKVDEQNRTLPSESTANLVIGRHGDVGDPRYFDGSLDDIQIYSYDLSQEQVKSLYNGGSAVRFGPSTGSP